MLATTSSKLLRAGVAHSKRNMSVVAGPPQVKISGLEQALHGIAIVAGMLAIPAWVLVNIKNYRAANP